MLKGFICEVTGQPVSFKDCLACAEAGGRRGCQFTRQILAALAHEGGTGVHVTMLVSCLRRAAFGQQREYYEKPTSMWARLQGTAFHLLLQRQAAPGEIVERSFRREAAGVEVRGTPDLIVPARSLVVDYKRPKALPRQPKEEHVVQVNVYRWLVAPRFTIDNAEVVYLGATGPRRFVVEVWPMAQAEGFVVARAAVLAEALRDGTLPPPEPEDTYCNYCPFKGVCGK